MNFRNPFRRLASKKSPESVSPTGLSGQSSEQSSSWDDLAKLNPDAAGTAFDDLAEVPFAGSASVTTASVVTLEEIISSPSPEELNSDIIKDSAERATNSPELHALKNFFKTDLRPEFVEEVKDKCVGYTFGGNLSSLVDDSQTINELLHAYHSYIMNNESILQKVPVVDQKENDYGYSIALRGDESPLSRQVFDALPTDLDVGNTDIIGADEHVMMMVRDRGHALTISAEPDQSRADQVWIEYNIPKLCNVEMIKVLPGLSGYTQNGARGGFFADRSELGAKVADFIGQVPTDDDMSKPGGALYGRF